MRQTPLLLSTLILAACGEKATEPQTGSTAPKAVASVQVTPNTRTLTAIGATQQFQATARDADGATISGKSFTWASSSPAVATVSSTGLATAATNGSTTITATTDGVSGDASLTVAQAVASVEVTSPEDTLTALGATASLTATPKDANGNPVAGRTATWSSSNASTATVDTDGTVTAVANGEVTITATVDGVDGSVALVVNQVAAEFVITTQPDGAAAGEALTTQPVFELHDSGGSLASNDNSTEVTAAIASGGGSLVGSATATAVGGVVAFSDLGIRGTIGDRTLSFSALGFSSVTSDVVALTPGPPSQLAITTQPNGAAAGQPLTTQPLLAVRDVDQNLVDSDNATEVTAAIASGGGTLQGVTAATAVAGIVTFTDLGVGGTVGDRTLTFSATGLTSATSDEFSVTPGPASQMSLSGGDNQTALADTPLGLPFSVTVADAFDNGVKAVDVGWSVTSGSGNLASATSTTDAGGSATNTYTLGRFAVVETIEASVGGLSGSPVGFSATATPNGTISGTITLTNALLSPPRAAKVAAADALPVQRGVLKQVPRPQLRAAQQVWPNSSRPAAAEYVPDELIVTFGPTPLSAPPIGSAAMAVPATAETVATSIQAALSPHVRPGRLAVAGVSPAILAARIKVANPFELDGIAAELRANPYVATVERNPIIRLEHTARRTAPAAFTIPNDPFYPWQAWHYAMMDLPEAWSVTTGSASILVAVIDDGIRFDHTGIAVNLTSDGYDFVSDTPLPICGGGPFGNAGDGDGYDPNPTNPAAVFIDPILNCISGVKADGNHGLHVAGTIGAVGNDGLGGAGVNWTVSIRPVRVLGLSGGSNYDVAQGLLYAAGLPADDGMGGVVPLVAGASIINMSLGGPTPSTDLENAVISASNAGALIVVSAGNDNTSAPSYPAAYPQTLSVSAVAPDASRASYSNFGSTIDIAAPGGELVLGSDFGVRSTAWDYVSGLAIWSSDWQGTSMAAPHVSGVAALLLAQDPALTAGDLKTRLINYAVDVGAAGRDDLYGWGIVNARNSLTQSFAPVQQLFARLIDASSGAVVQTVAAQVGGSYTFTELPDGDYLVYAGQDADGDQQIGVPGRRWGTFGGSASPTPVTVNGAGSYPASFTIGFAVEAEPNGAFSNPDVLAIGGYLQGTISDPATDGDLSIIQIPTSGQYTFETSAVDGACGFALEEDTILTLYDSGQTQIATNDDIDVAGDNFCSRISMVLSPGTYFAWVTGYNGGRYVVTVREGI